MDRLTKRISGGIKRVCRYGYADDKLCYGCVKRTQCNADIFERLAQYEDAEESGMLMRLPCPMGDTIYMIVTKRPKINAPEFSFIKKSRLMQSNVFRVCMDYGKTVFLTYEEAKAALEAMNSDEK